MQRLALMILLLICCFSQPVAAKPQVEASVQAFLAAQPGPLKHFSEAGRSAATIIENNSLYYAISPRLLLALLETTNGLLSTPTPLPPTLAQPFSPLGPDGFAAQIEWASRELRAGLGPYDHPPVVHFTDGLTTELTLNQAPEGVAVQRLLAHGRTHAGWRQLVVRFNLVFTDYFQNELPPFPPPSVAIPTGPMTLLAPWPLGTRMVHLAYFDHVYPTVDSIDDGNDFVVNYLGRGNVQYNAHDGHDYFFPDQPVGTPILAAAAGRAFARTHRGNGVVIVHPNGYETIYWHLDSFAPMFAGLVDSEQGLEVAAGQFIGTSGASGFVAGTPHVHFEVRAGGRQVDPYGWYGPGADPCLAYAGCATSTWLWSAALAGSYDFTPPGAEVAQADSNAPEGTLTVNPPPDLLLLAHLDGTTVQQVGGGFAVADGLPAFVEGRYGKALRLRGETGLTFPSAPHIRPAAGTISLWVKVPEQFIPMRNGRHYLLATSANPNDDERIYTGTLALRHEIITDQTGATPQAFWSFWTTPQQGIDGRDELRIPDTLTPGWHHIAVTWDTAQQRKALYVDGVLGAVAEGVVLPSELGDVIQLGRFTYGATASGIALDDLAIFNRALGASEVAQIAQAQEPIAGSSERVRSPKLLLDTNAADAEGGIGAVQLGRDGVFEDPQPYYDAFRWSLPTQEGTYTIAVRYFDRAGNSTTVTQSITLDLPPRLSARLSYSDELYATLVVSTTDNAADLRMQLGATPNLDTVPWQPFSETIPWQWRTGLPHRIYLRLRDPNGQRSPIVEVREPYRVYVPVVNRSLGAGAR